MSDLIVFSFGESTVRTITDAKGNPWFVVADVCKVLGIQNPTQACEGFAADDLSTGEVIDSMRRTQVVNIVSEAGLYQLIFASRKEEAKAFQRWVTKEVIPSIRKTGSYSVTAAPALPATYKEAVKALLAEIEAKEVLELENAALKPKAEFFDAVTASEDTLSMNDAAKLIGVGRNKLMARMRARSVFRLNNTPYQRYIDNGYFKVVESKWTDSKGDTHITLSTRVFQRGVEFMRKPSGAN